MARLTNRKSKYYVMAQTTNEPVTSVGDDEIGSGYRTTKSTQIFSYAYRDRFSLDPREILASI